MSINFSQKKALLGEVSGAIRATPSVEATRCAPDLVIKFSSVHVRPDSQ